MNVTEKFAEGFYNWMKQLSKAVDFYIQHRGKDKVIRFDSANPGLAPFAPAVANIQSGLLENLGILNLYEAGGLVFNPDILTKFVISQKILPTRDIHNENKPAAYEPHNFAIGVGSTDLYQMLVRSFMIEDEHIFLITAPTYGLFSFQPALEKKSNWLEAIALEKDDQYKLNPHKLEDKIQQIESTGKKVRVFLHINPNNPLGTVEDENDVRKLAEVFYRHPEILVIDDLAYLGMEYESKAAPLASVYGMPERTVTLFSLSKSFCIPSIRCGFAYGRGDIINSIKGWSLFQTDSPPITTVLAIMGTLDPELEAKRQDYLTNNIIEYKFRKNYVQALVNGVDSAEEDANLMLEVTQEILKNNLQIDREIAYTLLKKGIEGVNLFNNPEAGYFQVLDFSEFRDRKYQGNLINSSVDLTKAIAELSGVVILPGEVMHFQGNELVGRISYALPYSQILGGMVRLSEALKKLD